MNKKLEVKAKLAKMKDDFTSLREAIQQNFSSLAWMLERLQVHLRQPACQYLLSNRNENFFTLLPHQATYIKDCATSTQLLMSPVIGPCMSEFRFRITKSVEGALIIGVVDYVRQKDEHFSSASVNAVAWNGWSHGQVEFGGGNLLETEEGFREGDVVNMKVELEKGLITWEVEGKSSTMFYSSILQEPNR